VPIPFSRRTRLLANLLTGWLVAAALAPPVPSAQAQDPGTGTSFIVVDFHTRKVFSGQAATQRRPVASLTKIATALVVLDWSELSGTDLGVEAVVPPSAVLAGGANPLGMQPGDRVSLRDALYGALVGSDNVSAETLAAFVGGDLLRRSGRQGDPVAYFVRQMNGLAQRLGMRDTKFTNPHGMDHLKPAPYSTAADIARLTIAAMERASFRFFVAQESRTVRYSRGGQALSFRIKNTNELVGRDHFDGVKTGLTSLAGPCLVLSGTRDALVRKLPDGRTQVTPQRLVVVVLGAGDRFGMARGLLLNGWNQYDAWDRAGRVVYDRAELLDTGPPPQ
jgi:D-alanyl-D-alanine carboxypeptidase